VWADGVYVKAGLEQETACLLVVIGVMRDGRKELLALAPGYRESTESWSAVLRELKARGLEAPQALRRRRRRGDLGRGGRGVAGTAGQRCWNHAIVNVLDKLPQQAQRQPSLLLCAMPYAPTRAEALSGCASASPPATAPTTPRWSRSSNRAGTPSPPSTTSPEEHWKHIRTTNVIESPFAALRLRTGAAKRFKKVANATMLIWRVLRVAESRFRRSTHPSCSPTSTREGGSRTASRSRAQAGRSPDAVYTPIDGTSPATRRGHGSMR